jgi:zinc/manganese transport system substrate-binding protein
MVLIRRISVLSLALCLAGPAAANAVDSGAPVVVVTTSIWADIVDQIDCADHFAVETLVPIGGDAHSYEPSLRDRELLGSAALVVANGGGLEEPLHDTLEAVADEGTPVVEVVDHVTTAPLDDHGGDDDHEAEEHEAEEHEDEEHATEGTDDHEHEGDDPHVWFDPTLVVEAAPVIAGELVAAGADAATTEQCVSDLTADLEALDADIEAILSAVPPDRRLLVTNHDALGYFARRYGFEILGTVIPGSSTLAEVSPAELEQLSADIDAAGVPAIFAEALESTDEATALADRLGVEIVTLYTDSLGEEGSGAGTYADLMRFDANAIADALGD